MVGLLSGLFNVTVCVVFPIAIFLIILTRSKNAKTELKVFLVGVCTYLVAQILFRQPFLALLQSIDSYRILITTNRVAHIAILADRKSTRLNSSHTQKSRMPSSA